MAIERYEDLKVVFCQYHDLNVVFCRRRRSLSTVSCCLLQAGLESRRLSCLPQPSTSDMCIISSRSIVIMHHRLILPPLHFVRTSSTGMEDQPSYRSYSSTSVLRRLLWICLPKNKKTTIKQILFLSCRYARVGRHVIFGSSIQ